MHRRLALFSLVFANAVHAGEDPQRFADASDWDLQITLTCDGTKKGSFVGRFAIESVEKDTIKGSVHASTRTTVGLGSGIRKVAGKFSGTFDVDQKSTVYYPNAPVTLHVVATHDGGGSKTTGFLEIHAAEGYYAFGIVDSSAATKLSVIMPGNTSTSDGTLDRDFTVDKLAFPASGMVLSGTKTLTSACKGLSGQPAAFLPVFDGTVTWKFTPKRDLEAKPKLLAPAHRGEAAQLDGSDSTGHPTHYKWTLTPLACPTVTVAGHAFDAPPPPAAGKPHDGKTWNVHLLCDVKAKLTVSDDSGKEDSKEITVSIEPRRGKPFQLDLQADEPLKDVLMPFQDGAQAFGMNRCAEDQGDTETHHWIHTSTSDRSDNVLIDQIHDPDSPFDNWTYVSGASLVIHRVPLINSAIDGGEIAQASAKSSVALVVGQIKDHEAAHSAIVREQAKARDPGPDLEQLVGADAQKVLQNGEQAVNLRDGELSTASSESAVAARLGKYAGKSATLKVPTSDAICAWTTNDLQHLGEGQRTKLSCAPSRR